MNPLNPRLASNSRVSRAYSVFFIIPLVLSCFTHFWNLTGFPEIYMDEDIYMRKALHALEGVLLEEDTSNPIYGWLFLTLVLGGAGYPDLLGPQGDVTAHSIEMLYLIPRVLIGILGVLDTFLIYMICKYYHKSKKVAFIASTLFAVMPMTWMTRYVLLENIQLPFLLSSVLFAVLTSKMSNNSNDKNINIISSSLVSGIFLGLAIFIKTPAFAMIPLLGFIIYRNSKSLKNLGLWLIPVFLLPLMSPIYAASLGMFDIWWDGIIFQITRQNQPLLDFTDQNPNNAITALLRIDPIMLVAGTISIIFLSIRKDLLILLWTVPYFILFYFLGYVSFFHLIPLFPVFCIAFAKLIVLLSDKINTKNKIVGPVATYAIISGLSIFGLISTIMLITTNVNSNHFETAAMVAGYLPDTDNPNSSGNKMSVIMGQSRFYWILEGVLDKDHRYRTYWNYKSPGNDDEKIVMIVDGTFDSWKRTNMNKTQVRELLEIYNNTRTKTVLDSSSDNYDHAKYPYTSLSLENLGIGRVEIRTNSEFSEFYNETFISAMTNISRLVPKNESIVSSTHDGNMVFYITHKLLIPHGVSSETSLLNYMVRSNLTYLLVNENKSATTQLDPLFSRDGLKNLDNHFQKLAEYKTDSDSRFHLYRIKENWAIG